MAEISEKYIKKVFPLARTFISTNWNAFKKVFPLNGKMKLAVAGVSQTGRKQMVSTSQKISFH